MISKWFLSIFISIFNNRKVHSFLKFCGLNYTIPLHSFQGFLKLGFLDKLKAIFFSDTSVKSNNIKDEDSLDVSNFMKENLPMTQHFVEESYKNNYSGVLTDMRMFSHFYFFTENTDFSKEFEREHDCKDHIIGTYIMLRLFKSLDSVWDKRFYTTNDNENLIKAYFLYYKLFYKNPINIIFEDPHEITIQDLRKHPEFFKFAHMLKDRDSEFIGLNVNDLRYNFEKNRPEIDESSKKDEMSKKSDQDDKSYIDLYSEACSNFFDRGTYKLIKYVSRVRLDLNSSGAIVIDTDYSNKLKNYFPVKYTSSSVNKFINMSKIDNFVIYHLRKIKIFNKGRYSRNRQTYRTGFYWCLWLNTFVVYGLHFIFYRSMFTFGYLWIFLFILFGSFVFSRALKYNLISLNYIWTEIKEFFRFFKLVFINFYEKFETSFKKLFEYVTFAQNKDSILYSKYCNYINFIENKFSEYFEDEIIKQIVIDMDYTCEQLTKKLEAKAKDTETEDQMIKQLSEIWVTEFDERANEIYQRLIRQYQVRMIEEYKKTRF